MKEIIRFIRLEFLLDLRGHFSIGSLFLFTLTVCFAGLIALQDPAIEVWNSLFWIQWVFAGILFGTNTYYREARENRLYYFGLGAGLELYIAKWIFQFVIMLAVFLLFFGVMTILSYNPVQDIFKFLLLGIFSSACMASIVNFSSAIANLATGQALLMSVLSLPLLIPLLLLSNYCSGICMGLHTNNFETYLLYIISIMSISFGVGIFLVDNIWRS